jgi:hypothetical protein
MGLLDLYSIDDVFSVVTEYGSFDPNEDNNSNVAALSVTSSPNLVVNSLQKSDYHRFLDDKINSEVGGRNKSKINRENLIKSLVAIPTERTKTLKKPEIKFTKPVLKQIKKFPLKKH